MNLIARRNIDSISGLKSFANCRTANQTKLEIQCKVVCVLNICHCEYLSFWASFQKKKNFFLLLSNILQLFGISEELSVTWKVWHYRNVKMMYLKNNKHQHRRLKWSQALRRWFHEFHFNIDRLLIIDQGNWCNQCERQK